MLKIFQSFSKPDYKLILQFIADIKNYVHTRSLNSKIR